MAIVYSLIFGVAVYLVSFHYVQRFLDWVRFQSLGTRDYIVEKCNLMFIETTPGRVLLYLALASVGPFILVFLAFLPNLLAGLSLGAIAAVIGWKAPKPFINWMYQSRINKFNLQMVDGLGLMSNAMKSGLSVIQALGIVVEQMPNPMSQEFALILSENKVGVSVEESFKNLAKRLPCEDVEMFVTAVNILKETGGNLAETFDTIVYMIRERLKVENKIQALAAQGYNQGMLLLCIPPALGAYFYFTEPGFMDPVFNSIWGIVGIVFVVVMEGLAYFFIKKTMKVDV